MKKRFITSNLFRVLLLAFFVCVVLLPLISMLLYMAQTDVGKILRSVSFRRAALHSLEVGLVTTLVSVPIAYLLARFTAHVTVPLKALWSVLICLPMLIPSISQGSGLIILLGRNGVFTRLLHLNGNIYGFHGIIVGEAMYVIPVVYLMLADVLNYEDYTPYEAARVLGLNPWHTFKAVSLPFLKKPLISAVFTSFCLSVTDYGVPLTVGGKFKTLPVLMYEDVIGLLDFGKGSVIGAVLLIPAVAAFVIDLFNGEKGGHNFVNRPYPVRSGKAVRGAATAFCSLISLLMLLPIGAFCVLMFTQNYPLDMSFSLDNIVKTLTMNGADYLKNSLLMSLGTAVCGASVAAAAAYVTVRMNSPLSRCVHLLSVTSMAIPGLVLGLSYVLFFKTTFLYGTIVILILVNLVHFFASPYLMFCNTYGKLNGQLEEVGATLRVNRVRIFLDVLLPQCAGTILEALSYFFVNSMITISAVSFLANSRTKPVAMLIPQYEAQSFLECSAFVSVLILVCNLAVKGIVALIRRKLASAQAE